MAINHLYVSHKDYVWKTNTKLIDASNCQKLIASSEEFDVHTSPEDLGYTNIHRVFSNAQKITFKEFDVSKYNFENFASYGRAVNEMSKFDVNFTLGNDLNQTNDTRDTDSPVLWAAGCSITAGTGVSKEQAWPSLLAKSMNLPLVSLAKPSASIWYSVDQLMRSDLRPGDTVVLGITNVARIEYSKDWNFVPCTIAFYEGLDKSFKYWNIDYFESETQTLFASRSILQLINFCKKLEVKLYLINLLDINWIAPLFKHHPNFLDMTDDINNNGYFVKFVDVGSDNLHPGPKQHIKYAEKILNFIKEN